MSRFFAWMLNLTYAVVLMVASPWILWTAIRYGKYREGFAARLLGRVPTRSGDRPCVWLHAVSVGEVNLLSTVIKEMRNRRYDWDLVISTTTKAGYDLARKKYLNYTVFYCPLDFSWATRRAMQRVRPDLLVLAELELWPNLIAAAKGQGARVAIINGRLSDKSYRGYLRVRPLISRLLSKIDLVAAQNGETVDRFRQLGAPAERVTSTGSLKFDGAHTDRTNPKTRELSGLAGFMPEDVVFLAGSTQDPEEQMAIGVYRELAVEFPRLKLVIVPRHPQRFDDVANLLEDSGLPWICRSQMDQSAIRNPRSEIILVDTVGELGAWWGTATVGFVGGSFGSRGGQNMLEPAAYGVATCFGPNTWNFRDIVGQLLAVDGARVVQNHAELTTFVRRALADPAWAQHLGRRGRQLVLDQQGATARTVELLLPLLGEKQTKSRAA